MLNNNRKTKQKSNLTITLKAAFGCCLVLSSKDFLTEKKLCNGLHKLDIKQNKKKKKTTHSVSGGSRELILA